jgi:hypothetical protein
VQIQRLKSHLTTQQRGNKTGLVGASITINPGVVGLGGSTNTIRDDGPDLEDPSYSLKQETTEFLTQLSQSLSDENDSLIGLVRSTLVTLRELQGMPEMNAQEDADGLSVIGEDDEDAQQGMMHALPTSYETLASDTDTVLDNLKNLLTNPNFVSVDEVESREEEIHRLRAGWEKMEARLRESFKLMDSWRKRMTKGDTINLDEITRGLDYETDMEADAADDISMIEEEDENEDEDQDVDDADDIVSEDGEEAMEDGSSVFNEEVDEVEGEDEHPTPKAELAAGQMDADDDEPQPEQQALQETNGNKSPNKSPRKVAFSASIPNTPSRVEDENTDTSGLDLVGVEKSSAARAPPSEERASRLTGSDERTPRHVRCDYICDQISKMASKVTFSSSPSLLFDLSAATHSNTQQQTKKRHSSPHAHPEERSPKLTMHDKLKACQAEAEVAAARIQSSPVKSFRSDTGVNAAEEKKHRRATRSPTKPSRIGGRPKRRKSTLTPAELENLLGC